MLNLHDIPIPFGLGLSLPGVLLPCRKRWLPPVPVQLPSVAILTWLVITSLPAQLVTPELPPWLEMALILSRLYAMLQLVVSLMLMSTLLQPVDGR
jgi:hypothetical protein